MPEELVIDVVFDLICPWCLIGKRHLDRTLAELKQADPELVVNVHWHSVQLLSDMPAPGRDFTAFYLRRLGSAEAVRQRQAQVNASAQAVGFRIDFSRIPWMPNTLQAHQLLSFSAARLSASTYAALLERLFAAHFKLGENLGERPTLHRIAAEFDLATGVLDAWIDSGAGKPLERNVSGVPFFVFNRMLSLSGAQSAQDLLIAIRQAMALAASQVEPAL